MDHRIAAAGLELRGVAAGRRHLCVLARQATRGRSSNVVSSGARVRTDRDPQEQRRRLQHRVLRRDQRFCVDLAHLVDGRDRCPRHLSYDSRLRLPRGRGNQNPGRADCRVRPGSSGGGCGMNVIVALEEDVRPEARPIAREAGPAPKRIVVGYGFWIFLLSDIVMFAALFAAYAVLAHATAGGPSGAQLFNQGSVAIETACLLASSYTCGLMSLAIGSRRYGVTYMWALITFVLGAAFLALELREFAGMIAIGAGPQRSAFLSAFFTIVGCHGLHVTAGLVWLVVMMAQVAIKGIHPTVERRLLCFSLFWHALDIVWVGVFTVVYLMGVLP